MKVRPVPQYAAEPVGVMTYQNGVLTDPDSSVVTLEIVNTDSNTIVVPAGTVATKETTGTYQYTMNSSQTALLGSYTVTWSYTISGAPRTATDQFSIEGEMPWWSQLTYDERQSAANVFNQLSSSFDSTSGGPYLQQMTQSNFNAFENTAFIMTNEAMNYINYEFQPVFRPPYQVGVSALAPFPTSWWGILEMQTYAHLIKHIARQYIEQPTPEGMNAAWLNRRDYYERWMELYKVEKEISDKALRQMKRAYMIGSKRSMLVAGGLIPRMFINPARPHFMYASVNMGGM